MAFKSPPAKVHSYVAKLLKAHLIKSTPVWFPATTLAPPSPTFVRERDRSAAKLDAQLPFEEEAQRRLEEETQQRLEKDAIDSGTPLPEATTTASTSRNIPTRSARSSKHLRFKSERPQKIVYPEDRLRRRFYEDHPWELRRPRCLVETTGDGTQRDWSSLLQKGRSIADLTGEDVIQYQLYLTSTGKTEREAYHIATQEFYLIRAQEETEARVAKAQAMAFGLKPRSSFVMNGLKREEEALLEAEKSAVMF